VLELVLMGHCQPTCRISRLGVHDFGFRRSVVQAVPVPTRQHSPCAFLLTNPPHESEANGRLRRLQDAQPVPEEVGLNTHARVLIGIEHTSSATSAESPRTLPESTLA
jgi:hypothetical protein